MIYLCGRRFIIKPATKYTKYCHSHECENLEKHWMPPHYDTGQAPQVRHDEVGIYDCHANKYYPLIPDITMPWVKNRWHVA